MMNSMNAVFECRFWGSEVFYQHWLGLRYTEGVQTMAAECEAFWLIDLIASLQLPLEARFEDMEEDILELPDFQLWELHVNHSKGVIVCSEDVGQEILRQDIPYTDFPYEYAKLYYVGGVLMLPSEY